MNKDRRKEIAIQVKSLNNININLSRILSEEENVYDNMPENLQSSNRGIDSEEAIDTLNEVIDSLNEIIDNLRDISRS